MSPLMPPDTPYGPIGSLMPPTPPSTDISWSRPVLMQLSMTFGQPVGQTDVWSDVPLAPSTYYAPLMPPGGGIWWPRMVWTWIPLTCNHASWVFKRTTHPQYRYLVFKSGTTGGQHDMWSDCGSGWCLVRCILPPITPMPPPCPTPTSSTGI